MSYDCINYKDKAPHGFLKATDIIKICFYIKKSSQEMIVYLDICWQYQIWGFTHQATLVHI